MPELSPVVDTHTVTCPFPECTWREVVEIRAEYPPSMVQMFTDLAGQHREHHLGRHSGLDWAQVYGELVQRTTVLAGAVQGVTNTLIQCGGEAADVGEELGAALEAFETANPA